MGRRGVDRPPARAGVALSAGADEQQQAFWKEFFVYRADFVGAKQLVAGVLNGDPTQQVFDSFPIKIHSDSDFEWLKTLYTFTDPRIYGRLQDDSSGRRLHRSTLDFRLASGLGLSFPPAIPHLESTSFLPF